MISDQEDNLNNTSFYEKMTDDAYRYNFQMIVIPLVFGCASLLMFILNIYTHKNTLMLAALIYGVSCLSVSYLQFRKKIHLELSYLIFEGSLLSLFTFFLIDGGVDGFSTVWIILMACFGVPILSKKRGMGFCLILLGIILFFMWTPVGNNLVRYQRSADFKIRFPGVYIFAFLVGYVLEEIRSITNAQLRTLEKKYKHLSQTDSLTQIYNRYFLNESFANLLTDNNGQPGSCLVFIADIDNFKMINDQQGHLTGDKVLIAIADIIKKNTASYGWAGRWGGEEFLGILHQGVEAERRACLEQVRHEVANLFPANDNGQQFLVTISIGAFVFDYTPAINQNEIVKLTDLALYEAKKKGKNQVVYTQPGSLAAVGN